MQQRRKSSRGKKVAAYLSDWSQRLKYIFSIVSELGCYRKTVLETFRKRGSKGDLGGKIPNPEIQEIMKLGGYLQTRKIGGFSGVNFTPLE